LPGSKYLKTLEIGETTSTAVRIFQHFTVISKRISFDFVKELDFDPDLEIPVKSDPDPKFPSRSDPEIIFLDPTH